MRILDCEFASAAEMGRTCVKVAVILCSFHSRVTDASIEGRRCGGELTETALRRRRLWRESGLSSVAGRRVAKAYGPASW